MEDKDQLDNKTAERRRDEALRKALNTPPKLHKNSLKGKKGKGKSASDKTKDKS